MANYSIPTDKEIASKANALILADLSHHQSLSSLADQVGIKSHTLKRIFKKIYGQSIAEFSLHARMDKAMSLLVTTNNFLQMIADELGYTEGNNF